MSVILYAVGALTAVIGLALAGFGIPVKEFSFGNTLIQAGVTTVVGGLIILALGVVVAQLQRVADALTAKSPIRSTRPMDMFDAARAARVPFPAKPKAEMADHEPVSAEPRADLVKPEEGGRSLFAPSLRNPEENHVTVEEDVSLSPRPAEFEDSPQPASHHNEPELSERHKQAEDLDAGWRPAARPSGNNYFDALWPSDGKPASGRSAAEDDKYAEPSVFEPKSLDAQPAEPAEPELPGPKPAGSRFFGTKRFEPKPFTPKPLFDPKPYQPKAPEPKFQATHVEEPAFEADAHEEPKFEEAHADHSHAEEAAHVAEAEHPMAEPVAILKSGVVDGMAYTLYVDGSIEAELPQGTLRFASINELRAHLEKSA